MAHRNSESGFALIEVIVSAAVLAIMAMAVLSGIDAASNSSAREKARAVAASLAEQDQERMRAMSVETLAGLNETRPLPVDGVNYTVKSEAKWVTDDQGGTPSCGNSSKNNEYLHISTTVTSKIVGKNVKSIKIDSLVAPSVVWSSTHGILGVKVVDRNGVGVTGVTVSPKMSRRRSRRPRAPPTLRAARSSARSRSGRTRSRSRSRGYVDPEGKPIPVASQKVAPRRRELQDARLRHRDAREGDGQHQRPAGSPNTAQVSRATAISATNAKRISLLRNFPNASGANPITAASLYPFKDSAYAFFTGNCAYENPTVPDAGRISRLLQEQLRQPRRRSDAEPAPGRASSVSRRSTCASPATGRNAVLTVYAKLRKPAAFSTDTCAEPRMTMASEGLAQPGRDVGDPAQRDRPVGRPQRHRRHHVRSGHAVRHLRHLRQ